MSSTLLLLVTASLLLVACQPAVTSAPAPTIAASHTASTVAANASPTAAETEPTPTALPATATSGAESVTPDATPSDAPSPTEPSEQAANADVEYVRAIGGADGKWTFHVTVRHPDTGWEDYADGWDVVTPDGTVIKPDPSSPFTRLLLHPHETEQPFTRSQSGIFIPPDVAQVHVRAHDLVDGFGGREVIVDLTVSSGPDFEVERK